MLLDPSAIVLQITTSAAVRRLSLAVHLCSDLLLNWSVSWPNIVNMYIKHVGLCRFDIVLA